MSIELRIAVARLRDRVVGQFDLQPVGIHHAHAADLQPVYHQARVRHNQIVTTEAAL